MVTRRCIATLLAIASGTLILGTGAASAASIFAIRVGGNGHGIGMSQYGAYGYALHGWTYERILGHYYQGTGLRSTDPSQTVRVLLGTGVYGNPSFTGASSAVAISDLGSFSVSGTTGSFTGASLDENNGGTVASQVGTLAGTYTMDPCGRGTLAVGTHACVYYII